MVSNVSAPTFPFESFQRTVLANRTGPEDRLVVPIAVRRSADLLTPVSAFMMLREGALYPFLLESVEGGEKLARYSFLGRDPYRILTASDGRVETLDESGGRSTAETTIFDALKKELGRYREVANPDLPRFTCGAVGYLSYDAVRVMERLPDAPPDDLDIPDGVWAFYDTLAAFDHVRHQLVLMSSVFVEPDTDLRAAFDEAVAKTAALERDLSNQVIPHSAPGVLTGEVQSNVSREHYETSVRKARNYIREGDIFQVVLSQRFELSFGGDAFGLYRALRQINPSPYLFYLQFGDFTLVGSSPEVLVRVQDGTAEVLPIAGTRPRGTTGEEDRSHEQNLLDDPKERAEHLMLVDLGRNDLSRVAEFGTVNVDRYAYVERFSHVMHIVSSVSARLAEGKDGIDVLAACFPAGTVSGAPKVRAMEIIDELETTRRGFYAGTVGHASFSGDLDSCITIRTILVAHDRAYVQAGAGIVADSDPSREYEETVNKARALREAIEVAAGELLQTDQSGTGGRMP